MSRSALVALVLLAGPALPHEGHDHKVLGTVTAVHAERKHVEIETPDGKKSGFFVTEATKYVRAGKAAALGDLTVGTRVAVTTRVEGGRTVAQEVKLGPRPAPRRTPSDGPARPSPRP